MPRGDRISCSTIGVRSCIRRMIDVLVVSKSIPTNTSIETTARNIAEQYISSCDAKIRNAVMLAYLYPRVCECLAVATFQSDLNGVESTKLKR